MLLILPLTTTPHFITAVTYYDSLCDSENLNTDVVLFVANMVSVFNKYILSKIEACQTESILNLVCSTCCPQQQNVIDWTVCCRHLYSHT